MRIEALAHRTPGRKAVFTSSHPHVGGSPATGEAMRAVATRRLLAVVLWSAAPLWATLPVTIPSVAEAQEVPSNLQVIGAVYTDTNGVQIQPGNIVNIVNAKTQEIEGSGAIIDETGLYFITLTKDRSFNGTTLTMAIQIGDAVYALLQGSKAVSFQYNGSFPFPTRITENVTIGSLLSGSPSNPTPGTTPGNTTGGGSTAGGGTTTPGTTPGNTTGGGSTAGGGTTTPGTKTGSTTGGGSTAGGGTTTPGTTPGNTTGGGSTAGGGTTTPGTKTGSTTSAYDVNGDGVFDQADIDYMKSYLGKRDVPKKLDVNSDGIFNTRDVMTAIQKLSASRFTINASK